MSFIQRPWSMSITESTPRLYRETFFCSTLLRFSSVLRYCESLIACSCALESVHTRKTAELRVWVELFFFSAEQSTMFRGVVQKNHSENLLAIIEHCKCDLWETFCCFRFFLCRLFIAFLNCSSRISRDAYRDQLCFSKLYKVFKL